MKKHNFFASVNFSIVITLLLFCGLNCKSPIPYENESVTIQSDKSIIDYVDRRLLNLQLNKTYYYMEKEITKIGFIEGEIVNGGKLNGVYSTRAETDELKPGRRFVLKEKGYYFDDNYKSFLNAHFDENMRFLYGEKTYTYESEVYKFKIYVKNKKLMVDLYRDSILVDEKEVAFKPGDVIDFTWGFYSNIGKKGKFDAAYNVLLIGRDEENKVVIFKYDVNMLSGDKIYFNYITGNEQNYYMKIHKRHDGVVKEYYPLFDQKGVLCESKDDLLTSVPDDKREEVSNWLY